MSIIHIDVMNVCSIGYHSAKAAGKRLDGVCLNSLLSMSEDLSRMAGASSALFHFDGGENLRREIFPEYKIGRSDGSRGEKDMSDRDEIHRQVAFIPAVLRRSGRAVAMEVGFEADDTMARACLDIPGNHVIASGDKDMLQCVNERVRVLDPLDRTFWNAARVLRDKGVPPSLWRWVKAIGGCVSDEVPGVYRVAEQTAVKFVRNEIPRTSKVWLRISGDKATVSRNLLLVSLPFPGTPPVKIG
jgi:DNA polymerase-1